MLEKIQKILRDYKGDSDLTITESTTFVELDLDSLDTMDLVMSMEEEFEVTLTIEEAIKTVGDLIKLIQDSA